MTPQEFLKQRATHLVVGALAAFDQTTRSRILDEAASKLALIDDEQASEFMGALRFAGMQGEITDEAAQSTLQTSFAQMIAEFVNPSDEKSC